MTTADLHWLAGLLEGEACFSLSGGKANSARIALSMTDGDIVRRAAAILGTGVKGPVQPKQPTKGGLPRKPVYSAAVYGHRAAGWLMTLWPLLGERRRATAEITLAKWKQMRIKNPNGAGRRNPRYNCER